ncbi:hypothetical protein MKW92_001975, partial [Papaver armeniacum]
QVYRDCDIQEQEKIMDYSLLVGFALEKLHIVTHESHWLPNYNRCGADYRE